MVLECTQSQKVFQNNYCVYTISQWFISTPDDLPNYINLLGYGNQLGIKLSYIEQLKPEGLAQAFIIAEDFIASDDVCMILGDNIFHGNGLKDLLYDTIEEVKQSNKATIFGYYVNNPKRYGVLG